MSHSFPPHHRAHLRRIVYTGDVRVPLSADDLDMTNGYRCIPVPPTADGGWVIADDSSDRKTGWVRAGLYCCRGPPA